MQFATCLSLLVASFHGIQGCLAAPISQADNTTVGGSNDMYNPFRWVSNGIAFKFTAKKIDQRYGRLTTAWMASIQHQLEVKVEEAIAGGADLDTYAGDNIGVSDQWDYCQLLLQARGSTAEYELTWRIVSLLAQAMIEYLGAWQRVPRATHLDLEIMADGTGWLYGSGFILGPKFRAPDDGSQSAGSGSILATKPLAEMPGATS